MATVTTTANRLPPLHRVRGRGTDHDHSDQCNGLRGCEIMVRTGSTRSLAETSGGGCEEGQGRAGTRRNNNSRSAAEMSVLAADAVWRGYEVITAAQAAKSLVALAVSGGPLGDQPSRRQASRCRPVEQSGGRPEWRSANVCGPALLLIHQLSQAAVRRAMCRAGLSANRDRLYGADLCWARPIISVTFVRIGHGRGSSAAVAVSRVAKWLAEGGFYAAGNRADLDDALG